MGPTVGANCRGIGNAELLEVFIRTVEEVGKDVEGFSDGIAHTILPSFGSHDGGEILRAAIIHSRQICVQVTMRLYAYALRLLEGWLIKAPSLPLQGKP